MVKQHIQQYLFNFHAYIQKYISGDCLSRGKRWIALSPCVVMALSHICRLLCMDREVPKAVV